MIEPAIKGTLFSGVMEDISRLLEEGRLDAELVEMRLGVEHADLLREKIEAMGWYPIAVYETLVDLLEAAEAEGAEDYCHQRGRRAAARLIESDIDQQLDYLGRAQSSDSIEAEERIKAFSRRMNLIMTLQSSLVNFGQWQFSMDPDLPGCFRMQVREVAGVGDTLFRCAEGFFCGLAALRHDGDGKAWTYSRPSRDLAIFRMSRPI